MAALHHARPISYPYSVSTEQKYYGKSVVYLVYCFVRRLEYIERENAGLYVGKHFTYILLFRIEHFMACFKVAVQ